MAKLPTLSGMIPSLDTTVRPAPKKADRFYLSPEWRDLVRDLIRKRGRRCEACGKTREDDGSPVRLIGDHVVERHDGGADLDERNIRLLCSRAGGNGQAHEDGQRGGCHARKTAAAKRDRMARRWG